MTGVRLAAGWELDCSDDEKYDVRLRENGRWEPPGDVVALLFTELESGNGVLELDWKCGDGGRRPPTPDPVPDSHQDHLASHILQHQHQQQVKDEYFDFEVVDKSGQPTRLRPSGDVGPRGSAKKKTTSLHAILTNMERHRRMDMMNQDPESPPSGTSTTQQQPQQ